MSIASGAPSSLDPAKQSHDKDNGRSVAVFCKSSCGHSHGLQEGVPARIFMRPACLSSARKVSAAPTWAGPCGRRCLFISMLQLTWNEWLVMLVSLFTWSFPVTLSLSQGYTLSLSMHAAHKSSLPHLSVLRAPTHIITRVPFSQFHHPYPVIASVGSCSGGVEIPASETREQGTAWWVSGAKGHRFIHSRH